MKIPVVRSFKVALLMSFCLFPVFSGVSAEETPSPQPPKQTDVAVIDSYAVKSPEVEVVADQLEYRPETQKVIAQGNVVITYQDTRLTSDYAEVEKEAKKAYARGHVLIFKGDALKGEGEQIYYDFGNKSGSFPQGKTYPFPWYAFGDDIDIQSETVMVIKNARITTCDYEEAHYDVHASKATVYRGNKIIAWNVRIYALGKPIFWWPYLVIPLKNNEMPVTITGGYNSEYGAYVEVTKGFGITSKLSGKLLTDWRSRRGFGGGAVLDYDYSSLAKGDIIGYWTQDKEAPVIQRDDNPFSEDQERDRGRLTWRHRTDLDPYSFMVLRYHRVADEYFIQEFFRKEDRADLESQSFATITKNTPRYGLMLHGQKKFNDYEAMVQRLPEARFDWKNQPLLKDWLFYENQFSYANLNKTFGRVDRNEDVVRFDTVHELTVPLKWREVKFTPYTNIRETYYSREFESDNDHLRTAIGYGADLRTQLYKTFDTSFEKAGIEVNQLRHILEPSIRFDAIHPSTVSNEKLSHFDTIDTIDDKDVITFGIENRLQTKRFIQGKMQRVDIVSLNTFLRYEFHPDGLHSSSNFKILSQEVILRPYQWLQYEARAQYDMEADKIRIFNQDLILQRDRYHILIGHRYVNDPEELLQIGTIDTSHQFVLEGDYKINSLWTLNGYVRWDAEEALLEEWQLGASRDLHDFILEFGYNVRNSSIRSGNKEIYFNFRMKNFPQYALRSGSGRATFSRPRIGETVAGANQYGVQTIPLENPYLTPSQTGN